MLLTTTGAGRYLRAYAACDAIPPRPCAIPWATEIVATWLAGYPSDSIRIWGTRAETDLHDYPRLQERYGNSRNAEERILSLGQCHELRDLHGTWREDPPSIRLTVKFNVTRCTFPKRKRFPPYVGASSPDSLRLICRPSTRLDGLPMD